MDLRRTVSGPATTRFVLGTLALAEALAQASAGTGADDDDNDGQDASPRPAAASADRTVATTGATHDAAPFPARAPYGAFAGARLHALLARVRRRARRARDDEGWHRTRLAVKALRYAIEFARDALPRGADAARASALLARWQERLGADQDLASARDVAADALARPGVPAEAAVRALALLDGWRAFSTSRGRDPGAHARRTLRELRAALRDAAPARPDGSGGDAPASAPDAVR
jgi:CHAD domain-containing protein